MADRDPGRVSAEVDWREVARLVLTSREMDRIEEQDLVPAKKVLYQFSARGHDMAQVLLGMQLKDGDGAFGYYRSRPLLLALGVPLADALGSGMGLAGGYSDGRDIGVVFNYPNPVEASRLVQEAVAHVRKKRAPAMLRLTVPRLEGHSFQDTQTYKSEAEVRAEWARDPLPKLKAFCAKRQIGEDAWADLERETEW